MMRLSTPHTGRWREKNVSVGCQPGPTPSTQASLRATATLTLPLNASAYTALRNAASGALPPPSCAIKRNGNSRVGGDADTSCE